MAHFNLSRLVRKVSGKRFMVAGLVTLAIAGAAGVGVMVKQKASAANGRDCSVNSIDLKNLNGGCGAANAPEFIADVRQNDPGDLQGIYTSFGLSPNEYDRFASTARPGMAYKDGTIKVDGQTVATNSESIGRTRFSYARAHNVPGVGSYWISDHKQVLKSDIPVMVMFDENGQVEFAVLNACGNPVKTTPEKVKAECKMLNKTPTGEKDTYNFSTEVIKTDNVSVAKVEYNFGDGSPTKTTTNPAEVVTHKFTKSATVTVKVTFNLPGGKTKEVTNTVDCVKKVIVTPPPAAYYNCVNLIATPLNNEKTRFRFTANTEVRNGATLKGADFRLDNGASEAGTVQGTTVVKDYSFTDNKEHTIVATVYFNVGDKVESDKCQTKVTPEKAPYCPLPGKEHLPPNSPECVEKCPVPGKEHLPKDSPDCKEVPPVPPAELPKTGAGSVIGLFAGSALTAAGAHRLIFERRARKAGEASDTHDV